MNKISRIKKPIQTKQKHWRKFNILCGFSIITTTGGWHREQQYKKHSIRRQIKNNNIRFSENTHAREIHLLLAFTLDSTHFRPGWRTTGLLDGWKKFFLYLYRFRSSVSERRRKVKTNSSKDGNASTYIAQYFECGRFSISCTYVFSSFSKQQTRK